MAFLGFCLLAALPGAAWAGDFEDDVLAELNAIRADPVGYARHLGRHRGADPYEDPDALADAIAFLQRQRPLPPLRPDSQVAAAAAVHVRQQGPRGDEGHGPRGSLGQRLQGHGVWAGLAAEIISYGQTTPRDVMRQLVVDSGVPNRAHRKNVFGGAFQVAGVACGRHAVHGAMCVIDLAGALVQR